MSGIQLFHKIMPWVLLPGGGYHFVPFDYPFNTDPSFTHQWTLSGIREMNYTLQNYSDSNQQAIGSQKAVSFE